jgi:RNA polymerase subunit RPABC4/transcription elongation factor Spt4
MAKNANGTKICKYCKSEIPADAKICPHCRKKQGGIGKWIAIAIIAIIIISAIGSGGKKKEPQKVDSSNKTTENVVSTTQEEKNQKDDSKETAVEEKITFAVGETADFNGVQVTLSAAILSNGEQYFKPDDGKYFLGLIFDIKNDSSKDITVSSLVSFEAYCDDFSINQDFVGSNAPEWDGINQLDGSVATGKRMNGKIVFQVPKDFDTFEINYSPSYWGNSKATFIVTSESVDRSAVE